MKLFSFFLIISLFATLHAEEIPKVLVSSKIEQVTVYEDRAKIERLGEGDLPAGKSYVIFTNLPLTIDQSSVNISGASRHETKILGIEIREEYSETSSSQAVEQLKNEIQTVNDQKQILAEEKAMWEEQ